MRLLVIIFFQCVFVQTLSCQKDTNAHFAGHGKKEGFWPVFLDQNALEVDSLKATFLAYQFYSDGKNLSDFFHQHWKKKDSVVFVGLMPDSGQVLLLNGKFTWYDKKHQMITYEQSFENGKPQRFREIRYKKKNGHYTWAFIRTCDFTKRYAGQPGTYFLTEQNNLSIYNLPEWSKYWFRPGRRGWKKYRI